MLPASVHHLESVADLMQGRYLKGPENKIEHHPHLWVNVIGDESKNNVVYAKERNQQQS